ncbi:T9SS type A sorting domain-containing protein [Hymenobacter volaticus]|uniref:T9SS type A sorting domain-containing protein n=1 Tax=Hymenobacter volaticus TaxID=2932254 RepID=A0ABY4GCT5_9BACT|nr:T9SS type A sorting domain-containing protein [Hymenobacter volaticus]UOQ68587.1 T9SS type A sorting domain-containing protein [Hymenobacter volaticus]
MKYFSTRTQSIFLLGATLSLASIVAQAQTVKPFTAGNYVVVRIGNGSAALTNAATATFLVEYSPTGTLVQEVPLPTTNTGSNFALNESGSATSDANLTRSADGRFLILTGYNSPLGTVSVANTAAATTNRVIGRIAADGTVNTTTRINDAFDTNNIRSAASLDGSSFYVVGANSGVRYLPLGNLGPTTALSTGSPTNLRTINFFGGNLYVGASSSSSYGVMQVGTGAPTAAGQALALLPGFLTDAGPSSFGFFCTDQSSAVPGIDVIYVADDRVPSSGTMSNGGGIEKWSFVGGTWTRNGTIGSATAAVRGLTGKVTGSVVTLVASGPGGLYTVEDASGYNAAPTTAVLPAAFATAPTNTVFRGVALSPVATALAVRSAFNKTEATAFPNPAQQYVTVRLTTGSAGHVAEVHDLMGRLQHTNVLPTSGQLDLSGLSAGTYLLSVDGRLVQRISKTE